MIADNFELKKTYASKLGRFFNV